MTPIYAASHDAGSSRGGREQASTTLEAVAPGSPSSRKALWAGRVMSGFAVLFLLVDATFKVLELPPAVEGTMQLGFPARVVFGLGLLQLACLVVYLVPRTSVLGAVLWTGYLGGAVATHVRVGNPLSHTLFPIYVATFLWAGLWLRDERLRAVLPIRAPRRRATFRPKEESWQRSVPESSSSTWPSAI